MKDYQILGTNYYVARDDIVKSTEQHLTSYHRPDYTPEERQQVVDWLNGEDQPLPLINVVDRPGKEAWENAPPVMRPIGNFRVAFD